MSGVVNSIGKVFRPIIKTITKILPLIVAAAAIYFTAGAALGVVGAAGGWGAAASSMVTGMGVEAGGTLATVLTGAITQAGYGAAAGALISGITGGDISKGAQTGLLTGAVTGGVMGGLGMATDPLAGIGAKGTEAAATTAASASPGTGLLADSAALDPSIVGPVANAAPTGAVQQAMVGASNGNGLLASPNPTVVGDVVAPESAGMEKVTDFFGGSGGAQVTSGTAGNSGSATAAAAADKATESTGLFGAVSRFADKNSTLVGGAVSGIGQGLMGLAKSDSEGDASKRLLAERQAIIAGNYASPGTGLLNTPPANPAGDAPRPTPNQTFDPAKQLNGRYVYDKSKGQIVWMWNS